MRKIEFIEPVSAMRGNLSASQELVYDKNGSRFWGSGNYEPLNYSARYIGAKKSITGGKYFSVKTKSRVSYSQDSTFAMAAFGGACALARAAKKNLQILSQLQSIFENKKKARQISQTIVFVNWLMQELHAGLAGGLLDCTITDGTTTVKVKNPWKEGGTGTVVTVSQEIMTKFSMLSSLGD